MSKSADGRQEGCVLSWRRMDIEQKLGFRGAKYTDVNTWLALIVGVVFLVVFYLGIIFFAKGTFTGNMFLGRPGAATVEAAPSGGAASQTDGVEPRLEKKSQLSTSSWAMPLSIVFFAMWALGFLFLKWRKLALQRRALKMELLPSSRDFVLAPGTAPGILRRMYEYVDDPADFVLTCRIERALSNLRNLGRVSDVIDTLNSQADNDEGQMESSYTIVKGFIWAVPVLGFIGTVLGLSEAIGGFGDVLSSAQDLSVVTKHLKGVTGGLSTAFETTLQGLVGALCVQLLLAGLKKEEERFLDDCREYCHANIISRLRLIQLDEVIPSAEGDGA